MLHLMIKNRIKQSRSPLRKYIYSLGIIFEGYTHYPADSCSCVTYFAFSCNVNILWCQNIYSPSKYRGFIVIKGRDAAAGETPYFLVWWV